MAAARTPTAGATPPTEIVDIEADTLEEARELVRARVPDGLRVVEEEIVSGGEPKAAKATAATVEAALEKVRGTLPAGVEILETVVRAEPGEHVVETEAFSEAEARRSVKKGLPAGARIRSVRALAEPRKGVLGIGRTHGRYAVDVVQQAVVTVLYPAKARIVATIGRHAGLALSAERWGPAVAGVCNICNADVVAGAGGSALVPIADFKRVVESGYDPVARGRDEVAVAVAGLLGHDPEVRYLGWRESVRQDTTDWVLCPACAEDVRAYLFARDEAEWAA